MCIISDFLDADAINEAENHLNGGLYLDANNDVLQLAKELANIMNLQDWEIRRV